jgi:hypothetical protein
VGQEQHRPLEHYAEHRGGHSGSDRGAGYELSELSFIHREGGVDGGEADGIVEVHDDSFSTQRATAFPAVSGPTVGAA